MSERHASPIRMRRTHRDSLAAAIAKLQRSIDRTSSDATADSLLPHSIAQLDLLEELLDRAVITLDPEDSHGSHRS